MHCFSTSKTRAFTLVEMLVVLAITALLIALIMPAIARSRALAVSVKCKSNAYHINLATVMYANDNKDQLANPYVQVAANAPIASQGRFIGGADPCVTGAPTVATADNTLFGTLIPKAGVVRFYSDILVEGKFAAENLWVDPGRPAKVSLTVATNVVDIASLRGAFKNTNAAGTTVAPFAVPMFPMQYHTSLMLDPTTQNNSSVRIGTARQQYYTAASGVRHMKLASRPWPSENMWLTCTPMISTGPIAMSTWGYPQSIQPLHPSDGGTTNGMSSVFFDGHAETINRRDVYFGTGVGQPTGFTALGAGANGGTWPNPAAYPNFRPKFWDIRNITPLGGPAYPAAYGGRVDQINMDTGSVTP